MKNRTVLLLLAAGVGWYFFVRRLTISMEGESAWERRLQEGAGRPR